jgi:hypothetical protein
LGARHRLAAAVVERLDHGRRDAAVSSRAGIGRGDPQQQVRRVGLGSDDRVRLTGTFAARGHEPERERPVPRIPVGAWQIRVHASRIGLDLEVCQRARSPLLVWDGNASGFTDRRSGSPRVPSHPQLAPAIAGNVRKLVADSFGRHSASPPVPPRPARPGVRRREVGGKARAPRPRFPPKGARGNYAAVEWDEVTV